MFIFSVTLMYTWVMVGGVGFKYLEGDTFLSGVYFCLITVTAIGNSDIGPTTIQSQVIMMLWTIVATVVMGIYFINYTNFLLSLLETMKTNKLAKLLKKQVLLKIQHTQNRLESRSKRGGENLSLEHTKTSYDDVNLTRTRFNASARSSIVGDDFYGSENLRPISRTAKSKLNLYSLDGKRTSFKGARDAPSSIDSGFHLRNFSKEENVLEFDLIEEELEKLKNSPRLTMEIAIFIIVCILVWFGVISIFFAFRNKSYTFFQVFYYSFITYSTIGFGKNIYESDGEMIYFCIQVLLMVSLFGVFIAGISDFVQSWLTSIIKPEETDTTKRTETDKILSKVHKLLKRR
ncbi:hypothetical protein AX774_g5809 [Zancudomyces culisetae]|uniref:Potassium channel domain-containing protein n=1 Tax=Zancudomyces culisetae TaxID=1213189 RepID=A0A1R1PIB2_ZANCU|nr:hypothetical protein AX774_g5809 [Zancudomyces culisetae]|eukprot:OMH80745.1 hypothetical protein AX774_g5809 [Zancudomyces culisetae]